MNIYNFVYLFNVEKVSFLGVWLQDYASDSMFYIE